MRMLIECGELCESGCDDWIAKYILCVVFGTYKDGLADKGIKAHSASRTMSDLIYTSLLILCSHPLQIITWSLSKDQLKKEA